MKTMFVHSLLVGVGGFAGSVARYLLSLALQGQSVVLPAGTLVANWLGCFLIGMVAQLVAPVPHLTPEARLLLATGFCGGFTTMSSMIYEFGQFLRDGEYLHASAYVVATLVGSLVLFVLGNLAARALLKLAGGVWN